MQNNAKDWRRVRTTNTYPLSAFAFALCERKPRQTYALATVKRGKGTWVVQMHTRGGHSQLYTKSTAQNKLPVYFKFIVLKCEMRMCAYRRQSERRSTAGWNNNTLSLSLACSLPARSPRWVWSAHTLSHTAAATAALQRSTFIPLNHLLSFSFVRALHRIGRAIMAACSRPRLANNFP